jgi:di/tricarboxylate transporter
MIGTSTNLVVQGFLVQSKLPPLGFFEIAQVGLPAMFAGTLFMCTIGFWLLPSETGLFRNLASHASEFLSEMVVDSPSTLIGEPVNLKITAIFHGQAKAIKLFRPRVGSPLASLTSNAITAGPGGPADGAAVSIEVGTVSIEIPTVNPPVSLDSPDLRKRAAKADVVVATSLEASAVEADTFDAVDAESLVSPVGSEHLQVSAVLHAREEELQNFETIAPVEDSTKFQAGDRLILACHRDALLEAQNVASGATFVGIDNADVAGLMSQCYEVVFSHSNKFLGDVPVSKALQQHYGCVVLAIRRNGVTWNAGDSESLRRLEVAAGDTLLLLANDQFGELWGRSPDFYVVSQIGQKPKRTQPWQYGSVLIVIAMFTIGGLGLIEMEKAALLAAGLSVAFRFVGPDEVYTLIQWDLVVMIGASFGIGAAMEVSGLANDIARLLTTSSIGPPAMLFILYGVVLVMTELITNNAAAAIAFPIALNIAKGLGVSHKPFVIVVLFAATAAYALPIGYATHLIVFGPGGYTIRDFFKVGVPMDIIYWVVIAGLSPVIWPF